MSTVLSKLKAKISQKLTDLKENKRANLFDEQYIENLLSSKNFEEIESSLNIKTLLELKKSIILYKIKKIRNQSALMIQKMWNRYINKLYIHKLSHHLSGCYSIYLDSKGRTKISIKIFYDEENKDNYQIKSMRFCPIRKCFVFDIPKNKFYTQKKIMYFIFLNRNEEVFYDENYEKTFFFNEYVHMVDFSFIDKNQKKCEEKEKEINNLSTEDEKEYSENLTLTPTLNKTFKFEEDEYSGLRPAEKINNSNGNKRVKFESFDESHKRKIKLKSILRDSNPEQRKKRNSIKENKRRVSFGQTETLCFTNL